MAQSRAAIVAHKIEPLMPELLHHLDHVLGHDTETVVDAVRAGLGQRAVAIAAQVGQNDVIGLREARGDSVPRHVIDGVPVKHQQRRTRSAMAQTDDGALGAHIDMLETGKQVRDLAAAPARRIAHIVRGVCFGDDGGILRHRRCSNAGRCRAGGQHLHQITAAHALAAIG